MLSLEEKYKIQELIKIMKTEEVAFHVGVSKRTVYRYLQKIRAKKIKELKECTCQYCGCKFFSVFREKYHSEECMQNALKKAKKSKKEVIDIYTQKLINLQKY